MTLIFYFHIEHRRKRKISCFTTSWITFLETPAFLSVNIQWSVLAASVACNAALCAERSLCGVAIVDDGTTGGLRRRRLWGGVENIGYLGRGEWVGGDRDRGDGGEGETRGGGSGGKEGVDLNEVPLQRMFVWTWDTDIGSSRKVTCPCLSTLHTWFLSECACRWRKPDWEDFLDNCLRVW